MVLTYTLHRTVPNLVECYATQTIALLCFSVLFKKLTKSITTSNKTVRGQCATARSALLSLYDSIRPRARKRKTYKKARNLIFSKATFV